MVGIYSFYDPGSTETFNAETFNKEELEMSCLLPTSLLCRMVREVDDNGKQNGTLFLKKNGQGRLSGDAGSLVYKKALEVFTACLSITAIRLT
jgi:hypothetical protein